MDSMGRRIKDNQDLIAFYETAGKSDKEVEIRYAARVKGLYNGLKNLQGKLEGLQKYDLLTRKAAQEKEILDWIAADPARTAKYAKSWTNLNAFIERQKAFAARSEALNGVPGRLDHPRGAHTLVRAVEELQKQTKNATRPSGAEPSQPAAEHLPWPSAAISSPSTGSFEVDR